MDFHSGGVACAHRVRACVVVVVVFAVFAELSEFY